MSSLELVFLHIPKTAGTSQQSAFKEYCGLGNFFWIGNDCPSGVTRYPHELVGERSIVGGHKPLSFYPRGSDPLFCAILRDPIERAISLFAYYSRPDLAATGRDTSFRALQLETWRAKGIDPDSMSNSIQNCRPFRREITNVQCHYLSRGRSTFAGVKKSLKDADFLVGTVSQHERFRHELWELLDWVEHAPAKMNRGQDNYAAAFLQDEELVAQIAALNKEDQLLYDYVESEHNGLWRKLRDEAHRRRRLRSLPLELGKCKSRQWRWEDAPELWPRRESAPLEWPLSRMMIAEPCRLLYMPIPGAADAALQRIMLEQSGAAYSDAVAGLGIDRVVADFVTGLMLVDRSEDEIKALTARDDFFKFAVIYDPVMRLVDIYQQRFFEKRAKLPAWPQLYQLVADVQGRAEADLETGISFRQFCQAITRKGVKHRLWVRQVRYLMWADTYSRLYVPDQLHELETELSARTGKPIRINRAASGLVPTAEPSGDGQNVATCYADKLAGELAADPRRWRNQLVDEELLQEIKDYYSWDFKLYNRVAQGEMEMARG